MIIEEGKRYVDNDGGVTSKIKWEGESKSWAFTYKGSPWRMTSWDMNNTFISEYPPPKTTEPLDQVNKAPHYNQGGIECIDALQSALSPEEFRGFCKGNALKYTWREKHKNGQEDLDKAAWYLNKLKELND
jgi:hypothetical protein